LNKFLVAGLMALAVSTPVLADEAYTLKSDRNVAGVLGDLAGKTVTLYLRGGEKLTGKLSVAGTRTVQLTGLSGREFYDAVVALDAIDAVEVRARSQ